jgi:acetyl-CoA carboxylase biotin carboxyl carrier protein
LKGAILSEKNTKKAKTSDPMDLGLLQQLMKLMEANDLNTVDLRDGSRRVVLKRGAVAASPGGYVPAPSPGAPAAGSAGTPPVNEEAGLIAIKSPMVGTFYSKPNPESKPYVSIGSAVDEETDVCLIEAMKTFNTIKAECRGTIVKLLINDGQSVDVGKPLFMVKP